MKPFRLFLLLFFLPFLGAGQQLQFRTLAFEYGNEPLKVNRLFQDRTGFVWLGTDQGLFRYDGLQPTPFLTSDSLKPLPPVTALFQDDKARIWVGCQTGQLFILDDRQLTRFNPEEGTPRVPVLAFEQDAGKNIWMATYGEGLYIWNGKRLFNLSTDDGLPDNSTYTLARDAKGNIWTGTDRGIGICRFSGSKKEVRKLGVEAGLPDNIVTALAADTAGKRIWAGTYSGGFCQIDPEAMTVTVPAVSQNWPHGPVSSLRPVGTACFIGTQGRGLWEFSGGENQQLTPLSTEAPVVHLKVTDLLTDAEGLLWVAANSPEVRLANLALWFITLPGNQPEAGIQAVLADKAGNLWYSTDQGLFCARKTAQGYQVKAAFPELPLGRFKVISLYEDLQGYLWLGTFGGGVFRINPGTGRAKQLTEKQGLINNNVLSITGTGNEVWLATLGGASRCRLNGPEQEWQFENFSQRDGIGFNYIYQVFIDSRNRVWFATDGKGLTKLENGRFTNFSEKEGMSSRTVYSIAETRDGAIWVSTPKAGLFRFNGKTFQNYGPAQGLSDLSITSLISDRHGNLVVVHKRGLDLFDVSRQKFRQSGPESGLVPAEPNLNAVTRDVRKTVWIGGQKVLIGFEGPTQRQPFVPRTQLTSVQLFLKPIAQVPDQKLNHDENHITFEYAGLWYQNPTEVSYRLKLEGYDREWSASNNRSITYPRLPPGNYRFKVAASANGNFEDAKVVSYAFTIGKPFWNTIWFYLLVLLLTGSAVYGYVKAREKRVKKSERLEKDKVMFQFETLKNQVNPHFLFNSFNTLIGIIEDDQEAAVEYVEKLSDFFRDILVYREKDTITLREELVLIRNYYFLQQKRYGASLQMEITVPEADQELLIAPLTLQLLVENAIKHNIISRDKPLTVSVFTEPGNYLVVRNNLQKKKQPERSTGIGLENIRKRYEILGKNPVNISETESFFEVKVPLFKPQAL